MEPRQDKPNSDRKIMEEVPQEPIAADPDEGETQDKADDEDDEDKNVGQPVEPEEEMQ